MTSDADHNPTEFDAAQQAMQAAANRLSVKLQAFYEALPGDEREVMALLMRHFATTQATTDGTRAQLVFMLDTEGPVRHVTAGKRAGRRRRST